MDLIPYRPSWVSPTAWCLPTVLGRFLFRSPITRARFPIHGKSRITLARFLTRGNSLIILVQSLTRGSSLITPALFLTHGSSLITPALFPIHGKSHKLELSELQSGDSVLAGA